jgi:hypothetical protein
MADLVEDCQCPLPGPSCRLVVAGGLMRFAQVDQLHGFLLAVAELVAPFDGALVVLDRLSVASEFEMRMAQAVPDVGHAGQFAELGQLGKGLFTMDDGWFVVAEERVVPAFPSPVTPSRNGCPWAFP